MNRSSVVKSLEDRVGGILDPRLGDGTYSLLDFPDHSNVGDSAIWLGEVAYLSKRRVDPRLVTRSEIPTAKELAEGGTILLHGGGNFGDLWPAHQHLRIEVLNRTKGQAVIQLPQSIHFANQELVDDTARAIDRHGNFTLLVRDEPSRDFARKHFNCDVELAPDMAFCLGELNRRTPDLALYYLMRTDLEQKGGFSLPESNHKVVCEDWLTEPVSEVRRVRKAAFVRNILSSKANRNLAMFNAVARHRVQRGSDALSRGKVVITDRLHGHILCTLLGIPHVTLDNSYRKIGNFVDSWTSELDYLRTASTLDEAEREAQSLADTLGL